MKIAPFKLERYFAKYEFSVPYLLSPSDCQPYHLDELLKLADEQSLKEWHSLSLGYTESTGNPILRQEISKLYTNTTADQMIVCTPVEGIFITINALLGKGDHIICAFPGYQSLYQVAESIGCEVTKWKVQQKGDKWVWDLNSLKDAIKNNTKAIIINFPHNPTGSLITKDEFKDIIDLCRKNGLYLFSDEMYWYLENNPQDRLPAACDIYEKAISLFGMSKTFALPGLRIGWIATHDQKLLQKIGAMKDYTTICSSAPSEMLSIIGLRAKDTIISRNLEIIKLNIKAYIDFFDAHKDMFTWIPPQAGSTAFPQINSGNAEQFCHEAVTKAGIMILPSTVYDYGNSHFRVGLGRKNIPEILSVFGDFLKTYV